MTAAVVRGFDIDQMRKIVSDRIGLPVSRPCIPSALNQATGP